MCFSRSLVLSSGRFTPRVHLEMFPVVLDQGQTVLWHLLCRSQKCGWTSYNELSLLLKPVHKIYLHNVNILHSSPAIGCYDLNNFKWPKFFFLIHKFVRRYTFLVRCILVIHLDYIQCCSLLFFISWWNKKRNLRVRSLDRWWCGFINVEIGEGCSKHCHLFQ